MANKLKKTLLSVALCSLCGPQGTIAAERSPSDSPQTALVAAPSDALFLQKGTPYHSQQDPATYEAPPPGFVPIFAQLVARHGSRGLIEFGPDFVVFNMWQKAQQEHALTAAGIPLGPDVEKIMQANALLGYGVAGISGPIGYGNETRLGLAEHTALAHRMWHRLQALFDPPASDKAKAARKIIVVSSGVPRTTDSGSAFVDALLVDQPSLKERITLAPAPTGYPAGAPVTQPAGTNRFLLLFSDLGPQTDQVAGPTDPMVQTYQDSLAFQQFRRSDNDLLTKQQAIARDEATKAAARVVLERLFTKEFVDKIEKGTYTFSNKGVRTFNSADGKVRRTLSGRGNNVIHNLVDAALQLYELYSMAPAIYLEAGVDFSPYMSAEQAGYFEYYYDAMDFYNRGPGIAEKKDITYRMAQILLDDFFNEVDTVAKDARAPLVKLRFGHDVTMAPFASILHLKEVTQPLPLTQTYTYQNSSWRGKNIAGMAANVQWDVYRNEKGVLLVKMLYNEKETDFQTSCDYAKNSPQSHFYDYAKLKTCYQHTNRS